MPAPGLSSPPQDSQALQLKEAAAANGGPIVFDDASPDFEESNLMHSINGYVYCNGPLLKLPKGTRVRWAVMGFGSESGMHAPVFTGQEVAEGPGRSTYSVGLMPSSAHVVEMRAVGEGSWRLYCNILDHVDAGMMALMDVVA